MDQHADANTQLWKWIQKLNEVGCALSSEKNRARLLERILLSARELTSADAGTLYILEPDHVLRFAIVQNDSLRISLGGTSEPVGERFPLIRLYRDNGEPNEHMVVAWAVLHDQIVNIPDAYDAQGFDFSGTRRFDASTGYRSRSFLTIPMKNHEGEIIAVLQLLNKKSQGQVVAFDTVDEAIAGSLASQAAIALTNQRLIEELRHLFDSFVQVIARGIDAKSPHTGTHCRRVPDATLLLAEAASRSKLTSLADFNPTDEDYYEIRISAWLHDCGKIITPHHIMEKSTKLQGLFDRIELISARFEILQRDLKIQYLQACLDAERKGVADPSYLQALAQHYQTACAQLEQDLDLIRHCNTGQEFTPDAVIERIQTLAQQEWRNLLGHTRPLLEADEVENLSVRRGTLNARERKIMEDHMVVTLDMLDQLPFPKYLKNVPEYAGGHHERMDGRGYPKGLTREQMSVPARIMGIADVFEALTAPERPYKQPMPLSQALSIMQRMVEDQHLDPDLFEVFIKDKVYLAYAKRHLHPSQIDVDHWPLEAQAS